MESLRKNPARWLVTGAAGFIGSHLVEKLLRLDQRVVGLDDFSTGTSANLRDVEARVGGSAWKNFRLLEGSVCAPESCRAACARANYVLHQAGFVSVPLSLEDPAKCNAVNVDGFLNILLAARDTGASRIVYASSSAVYGDDERLPKVESQIGKPLSPYGASKLIDEIYASTFRTNFGLASVGLRYFNVFGPRQSPTGGYAAVIPQWISNLVAGRPCKIHGDGSATRDFCHIENVVQANLLAAITPNEKAVGEVFNVGNGGQTSLTDLYRMIAAKLNSGAEPIYGPERPGDILHSGADITKIKSMLQYDAEVSVDTGLEETVAWYAQNASASLDSKSSTALTSKQ